MVGVSPLVQPRFADAQEDVATQLSQLFPRPELWEYPTCEEAKCFPWRGWDLLPTHPAHNSVLWGKVGKHLTSSAAVKLCSQPTGDPHSSNVWGCGCTPVLQEAVESLWCGIKHGSASL